MKDDKNMPEEKYVYEELPQEQIKDYSTVKNMNLLYDVPVLIRAKLGKTLLSVEKILKLDVDMIIELDTNVGDTVELYANDILIGYGEIIVVNEDIGIKVTQINIEEVLNKTIL